MTIPATHAHTQQVDVLDLYIQSLYTLDTAYSRSCENYVTVNVASKTPLKFVVHKLWHVDWFAKPTHSTPVHTHCT